MYDNGSHPTNVETVVDNLDRNLPEVSSVPRIDKQVGTRYKDLRAYNAAIPRGHTTCGAGCDAVHGHDASVRECEPDLRPAKGHATVGLWPLDHVVVEEMVHSRVLL